MVQSKVQPEILNRVFGLYYNGRVGTAFTMECKGSQFLVTAKHMFRRSAFPGSTTIGLLTEEGKYTPYEVEIKYPKNQQVDIAVMKLKDNRYISKEYSNPNTSKELALGQDVFYLGFPSGYDKVLMPFSGTKRPIPFIKKACFSGRFNNLHTRMIFDGYVNEGFSGGPVCYKPDSSEIMSIAAVVAHYYPEKQPVINKDCQSVGSYVETNTGIIIAYDISEAVKVAERWNVI